MASRTSLNLRGKLPQLLVLAFVAVVVIVLVDISEDMLIEGGAFADTHVAVFLSAVVAFIWNVTVTVQSWGYSGLFVLMALESSSLPIPSEVVLPFAGYLVSQGLLNFWLAVLVSTLAGIAGSLIDYYIGLKGMSVLAKRNTLRHLLYSEGRMDTAERWFEKHGSSAVFLSRLVPGFRTLVSFPAGAVRMPISKFTAYTTAGCLFWDIILIYVGVYVGANWRNFADMVHYLIIALAVAVLIALVLFLITRRKKKQPGSSSSSSLDQPELG